MSDPVNKPAHYNAGSVETIDGIRAALGEGFADYCKGNVLKYVWRCGKKGDAVEDLRKAAKYLEWAIEAMESNYPVIPDSSDRKPLAIPAGWRELELRETPLASDMYEHEGMWTKRSDDASCEYEWYDVRHIRKIETANPSATPNSSWKPKCGDWVKISKPPAGERTARWFWTLALNHLDGETRQVTRISEGIDAGYQVREIDGSSLWLSLSWLESAGSPKEETANPSETPNSSMPTQWIPRVGDRVRVLTFGRIASRYECVITEAADGKYTVEHLNLVSKNLEAKDLELIEAAL